MNIHHTKGVVLRTVKYGETSLIVSIYTELFGIQSYLVNGVRSTSKKGSNNAALFQPAALLDLCVYHNEMKNLQRIKEYKWEVLYQHLFSNIWKNAVALFMIELLQKTIKQPEANPNLFHFIEDAFIYLDNSDINVVANYPLYFSLHLASLLGLRFSDTYDSEHTYLDLEDGLFVKDHPIHPNFLEGVYSEATSQLLKAMQPCELSEIKLNQAVRRVLLQAYKNFYALHISEFGTMRTLPVLQEVLG